MRSWAPWMHAMATKIGETIRSAGELKAEVSATHGRIVDYGLERHSSIRKDGEMVIEAVALAKA